MPELDERTREAFAESARQWREERDRNKPPFLNQEQWRTHLDWLQKEEDEKPETLPPLSFIDGADWNQSPPPQQWTVDQLFPRCETTLFSGNGGAGKSTIGLQLCCAHALAKDWMGVIPEPGPALFVDAEDHELVIRRRTYAIAQHYQASPSDLFDRGLKIVSLHGKDAILASVSKGLVVPTDLYKQLETAAEMFQPQTIVIASAANCYGGNEIDRSQVTQFIGLTNRLAVKANGSVILISHPSVLGMENNSGISGSTGWHNAVRSRIYLSSTGDNGEELKKLEFRKNQYGPISASITLKWKDGLFLPVGGPDQFQRAASDNKARELFGALLAQMNQMESFVSADTNARNYAPRRFAETADAKTAAISKTALEQAMRQLFNEGRLQNIPYGKKSNQHTRIEFADVPPS